MWLDDRMGPVQMASGVGTSAVLADLLRAARDLELTLTIECHWIAQVTLDPSQTSIHAVASNSKLFKELVNTWSFAPGPSNAAGPTTYVDIAVSLCFPALVMGDCVCVRRELVCASLTFPGARAVGCVRV
jgi:hypothetical protein